MTEPAHRTTTPQRIDFHFDPMCPWAYQGSLWIREVRRQTALDISWRFFSLEEINLEPGKKHPWEREWSYGWSQMRVGARLRRDGQDAVDRWYEAVGHAFFVDGRHTHDPRVHREVMTEAGFDPALVDEALADATTTDEVLADHRRVTAGLGAFGVPTIVFPDGNAVFGPIILPAPIGAAALRLWDLLLAYNEFPNLWELRHPRSGSDLETMAETFRPYLEARAWKTVANPAP
jgi:predicted DsbA family dithiol-disulfide isomerase